MKVSTSAHVGSTPLPPHRWVRLCRMARVCYHLSALTGIPSSSFTHWLIYLTNNYRVCTMCQASETQQGTKQTVNKINMSTPFATSSLLRGTGAPLWVLITPTKCELCLHRDHICQLCTDGDEPWLCSRTESEQSHVWMAWNLNEGPGLNIKVTLWEKASKREAKS